MFRSYRTLASQRGQGTVEYVALIMLVALVFAAVVKAGAGDSGASIAGKITKEISAQINKVGSK